MISFGPKLSGTHFDFDFRCNSAVNSALIKRFSQIFLCWLCLLWMCFRDKWSKFQKVCNCWFHSYCLPPRIFQYLFWLLQNFSFDFNRMRNGFDHMFMECLMLQQVQIMCVCVCVCAGKNANVLFIQMKNERRNGGGKKFQKLFKNLCKLWLHLTASIALRLRRSFFTLISPNIQACACVSWQNNMFSMNWMHSKPNWQINIEYERNMKIMYVISDKQGSVREKANFTSCLLLYHFVVFGFVCNFEQIRKSRFRCQIQCKWTTTTQRTHSPTHDHRSVGIFI